MTKTNKKIARSDKSSFKYASPAVAMGLIVFGLFFGVGGAVSIGIILGFVWLFRYSRANPKLHTLMRGAIIILLALLAVALLYYTVADIRRFM